MVAGAWLSVHTVSCDCLFKKQHGKEMPLILKWNLTLSLHDKLCQLPLVMPNHANLYQLETYTRT